MLKTVLFDHEFALPRDKIIGTFPCLILGHLAQRISRLVGEAKYDVFRVLPSDPSKLCLVSGKR